MILVTGAAGKTGLAVIRALARKGETTRALVHHEDQVETIREAGAQEVTVGDIKDGAVLVNATSGVDAIYLICPNVHPREFEIGKAAIMAAQQAGVSRIVYHSVMYPQIEAMPHHWQKWRVEEALIQIGLAFTILQPASYIQNILPYWDAIIKRGEYTVPYSVDSVFSPVDLEDVAEVASVVLTNREHDGAIYQLAGPDFLSSAQMAKRVSKAIGREVKALEQKLEDWRRSASESGVASYSIDALSKMFNYYDQHDFSGSGVILEELLGRQPTGFEQFIHRIK
jgi:NAD(P)H dehydrogenase (quinone)